MVFLSGWPFITGLSPDLAFFQVIVLFAPAMSIVPTVSTVIVFFAPAMLSESAVPILIVFEPPPRLIVVHGPLNVYLPPPFGIDTTGSFLQSHAAPFSSLASANASAG